MKKTAIYLLILAGACFAQFPGPPCSNPPSCTQYPPVSHDTLSGSSKFLVQVPPYNNVKLRSITAAEIASYVGMTADTGCTNGGHTGSGPCVRQNSPIFYGATSVGGAPNTTQYVDGRDLFSVIAHGGDSVRELTMIGYNTSPTLHAHMARILDGSGNPVPPGAAGDTTGILPGTIGYSFGMRGYTKYYGWAGSAYANICWYDDSTNVYIYGHTHCTWEIGNRGGRNVLMSLYYNGMGVGDGFSPSALPRGMLDVHGTAFFDSTAQEAIRLTAVNSGGQDWTSHGVFNQFKPIQFLGNEPTGLFRGNAIFPDDKRLWIQGGIGGLVAGSDSTREYYTNWGTDITPGYVPGIRESGPSGIQRHATKDGDTSFVPFVSTSDVKAPTFNDDGTTATFGGENSATIFDVRNTSASGSGTMTLTASPCPSGAMTWIPMKVNGIIGYIPWCNSEP